MQSEPEGAGNRQSGAAWSRAPRARLIVGAAALVAGGLSLAGLTGAMLEPADRTSTSAATAAARHNGVGYEMTAAALAMKGEDPVARRQGLRALQEARLQLLAGPPPELKQVADDSGRDAHVTDAFDALAGAAGQVITAAEQGQPLDAELGELERRAALYRLGIDSVLLDAALAAEAEMDATRRFELTLLAAVGLLAAAVAWVGLRSRRPALVEGRGGAGSAPVEPDGPGLLRRSLSEAIVRAQRASGVAALLLVDLDLFNVVNDRHGREVGDELLRQVARRLRSAIRDSDTVAAMGGDEFAIVVEGVQRPEHAGAVAEKVLATLAEPFDIGDRELAITASVGIVLYPLDGLDADELLRAADTAMYAAKGSGRNRYHFSTEELRARTSERTSLIEGLRQALERPEELELRYQPKIDMATGELVGVEALLRWHHPELGMVLPDRFIYLAEETDLIVPLGRWVIAEACAQAEQWRRAGQERLKVSVNVSSRQFRNGDLVETITDALAAAGLDPRWLEVELTEGTLAEDTALVRRALERLKAMGVQVAIDDFGTGYSSLSYLKRFPIDALKIDRSFIRDVTVDPDDAAISQAIVSLARSLRLQVVAEGVETPEQLEFVRALGCDTVQGFLISKPLPVEGVDDFVVRLDDSATV